MPPSPALRYSPGRELRADNHKRGRSLEGGLLFKQKDDDLALFNEMQSRERENFLLQSSDDLEDTFSSKLRHFSDHKLGISIPARGESSELLNGDGEKNDYDWLVTPPDTPLFPSLDDEPPLISAPSRGRPRSQPITISRSSTMEKSYRSSRGSASPNRLSSSPRSVNSMSQSRGRSLSAHCSSPTPSQRSGTPTRRPSPPPSKPSTPVPRSSTPTPRRSSVSGTRGTSPIRTARGNSASPKIRAWQSNIPGFSSEVPPNLRTSLADRPASYVRGSSPASRNGRDSSSKVGRQSMSPTASRSVSSSHSQDRDRISSHSKGSVASSGDDDVDSLQSVHVGSLDRLAPKRIGAFPNNRAAALSKKSSRILSPSSAPKRSFDSALRQMDHRKSPQNMFRPLLSSVPSSTFYAGKGSSVSRTLISRNSSVTTSSNTSSDHGTAAAIDTEGSDPQHEDMVTENENVIDTDIHEEIFPFDKGDVLNRVVGHGIDDSSLHSRLRGIYRDSAIECEHGDSEEFSHHDVGEICSTSDALYVRADNSEVDSLEHMKVCSRCGCRYHVVETVEMDIDLCPDCYGEEKLLVAVGTKKTIVGAAESSLEPSTLFTDECRPSDESESLIAVSEVQPNMIGNDVDAKVPLHEDNGGPHHDDKNHTYHEAISFSRPVMEAGEQRMVSLQGSGQPALDNCPPDDGIGSEQLMPTNNYPNLRGNVSEGAGISVLLTRSSSSKGPVVQGRTFVASTVTYNDLSYARESGLRSSIGHGSTSTSSSHDFASARLVDTRVQRQLSGKKLDMDNYRHDSRPQSSGSSLSGTPNHSHQALGLATSSHEESAEVSVGDISEWHESSGTGDVSTSDLFRNTAGFQLEENSKTSFTEENHLHEDTEDFPNNAISVLEAETETSVHPSDFSVEADNKILNNCPNGQNVTEVPTHRYLASISEIEAENSCQSTPGSENGDMTFNDFQDPSLATPSDKNNSTSVMERNNSDYEHDVSESTVMIQCREGSKGRSLTLEEATDTILFCSSIVHDLAYEAATIAIEKENSAPLEDCRPTITVVDKPAAGRRDQPRGKTTNKRNSKSQKVRQRMVETDVEPLSPRTENDENANAPVVRNVGIPDKMDSAKPMKLESKCNCTIM